MLDNVAVMFENMNLMMGRLNKKNYEKNMAIFKEKYGRYIDEMMEYITEGEEEEKRADEICRDFCAKIKKEFANAKGKISAGKQLDLNMYMIYYMFPTIGLIPDDKGKVLNEALLKAWNNEFNEKIGYASYEEIYNSFREKLFGIF